MNAFKWLGIAAAVVVGWFALGYISLVNNDESVNGKWGEYQNQLMRRADLFPTLGQLLDRYKIHEEKVQLGVAQARTLQVQIGGISREELANSPDLQRKLQEMEKSLTASLNAALVNIRAVAEQQPNLKADTLFAKTMDEVAGTQNRVAVARGRAIEATISYNQTRRTFGLPVSLAMPATFPAKEYYKAPPEAEKNPQLFN